MPYIPEWSSARRGVLRTSVDADGGFVMPREKRSKTFELLPNATQQRLLVNDLLFALMVRGGVFRTSFILNFPFFRYMHVLPKAACQRHVVRADGACRCISQGFYSQFPVFFATCMSCTRLLVNDMLFALMVRADIYREEFRLVIHVSSFQSLLSDDLRFAVVVRSVLYVFHAKSVDSIFKCVRMHAGLVGPESVSIPTKCCSRSCCVHFSSPDGCVHPLLGTTLWGVTDKRWHVKHLRFLLVVVRVGSSHDGTSI